MTNYFNLYMITLLGMIACYQCQNEIELSERVGRKDICPFCGADLHCCRNCKFYDESAHNQCKEPNSEWVSDREKSNFCDYFSFTPLEQKSRHLWGGEKTSKFERAPLDSKHLTGRGSKSPPSALDGLTGPTDKARARAEALFKKE